MTHDDTGSDETGVDAYVFHEDEVRLRLVIPVHHQKVSCSRRCLRVVERMFGSDEEDESAAGTGWMQAPQVRGKGRSVNQRLARLDRNCLTACESLAIHREPASLFLFLSADSLAASSLRRQHPFRRSGVLFQSSGPENPFLSFETVRPIIPGIIVFHEVCFDTEFWLLDCCLLWTSDKTSLPQNVIRNKRFKYEFGFPILEP